MKKISKKAVATSVASVILCVIVVLGVMDYHAKVTNQIHDLERKVELATEFNEKLTGQLDTANGKLEKANKTIKDLKNTEYKLVYMGNYTITHYCGEKCEGVCGTGNGQTATGTKAQAGRTIAIDPTIIPYGTEVYIDGYGWRVAEDCGGAIKGKKIDMFVNTHSEAMKSGKKYKDVWVLVKR